MKPRFDEMGDPNGCYELSLGELEELGVLCKEEVAQFAEIDHNFRLKGLTSTEFLQDMHNYYKYIYSVRTPAPTNEEWEAWEYWGEKIDKMDLQELRKKVVFLEQYPAYDRSGLDVFYTSQFVQNEICHNVNEIDKTCSLFCLYHQPVLPGTLEGTLYKGSSPIQTFKSLDDGKLEFTDVGDPTVKAYVGSVNYMTGDISVHWTGTPAISRIVVCYEYDIQ